MAEISKIKIGEQSYDIKDSVARESISGLTGAMHYIGKTTTQIEDGSSVGTVDINLTPTEAKSGDVVIYEGMEFVWDGERWSEFGSTGSLKALAFKDEATGNFTPLGQNSPSSVTLEGGTTGKLETTNITGVEGTETLHDTPTPTREDIGSASGWNPGTMFTASVSGDELVLTPGSAPTLTIQEKQVVTNIQEGEEKIVAKAASSTTTVATGSVSSSGQGSTVATALPTGGTAAAQTFAGTGVQVTVK